MTAYKQSRAEYCGRYRVNYGSSQSGFTLLELMIVIAIIGILVAIAVPSYEDSVVKTNRKAVAGCLLEASQFMERYYTTNLSYTAATLPALSCITDVATSYTLTLGALTATTYTMTATPIGRQLAKDTLCSTMTIDSTGTKTVTGTATANDCWTIK